MSELDKDKQEIREQSLGILQTWLGGPTDTWYDGVQRRIAAVNVDGSGAIRFGLWSIDRTQLLGHFTVDVRVTSDDD